MTKPRAITKAIEIEKLRKNILDLSATHGMSEAEIGERLNCSQQKVSYHLRKSFESVFNSNLFDAAKMISIELARIDHGEKECWKIFRDAKAAWRKSIGLNKVTMRKVKPVPMLDGNGKPVMEKGQPVFMQSHVEVTVREIVMAGDASLLRVALESQAEARLWQARRAKLMGLDKPKKLQVILPSHAEIEAMTDDELVAQVLNGVMGDERMLAEMREKLLMMPNGNGNNVVN